jgi:hypothetical protein
LTVLGWLTLVVAVLVACGFPATQFNTPVSPTVAPTAIPSAVPPPEPTAIEEALAYVPASYVPSMHFTNWARIKAYEGAESLTSWSPWSERRELFRAAGSYNPIAFYAPLNVQQHAPTWGWDFSDLEWEALITLDEYLLPGATKPGLATAHVLKLRDDIDLAPIVDHFIGYGFAHQTHNGIDIYSRQPDNAAPWAQMADPAVLNTAIMLDQKVLILAEDPAIVHLLLDTWAGQEPPFSASADLSQLILSLDDPATAFIAGESICRRLNPLKQAGVADPLRNLSADQQAELKPLLDETSPLHAYNVFAFTFRKWEDGSPNSEVLLAYPERSDAQADFNPREMMIRKGVGLSGTPYVENFTSFAGGWSDRLLWFSLPAAAQAGDNHMNTGIDLLMRNDMLFAACP